MFTTKFGLYKTGKIVGEDDGLLKAIRADPGVWNVQCALKSSPVEE